MKKILVMIALMLSFLVGNDADRYMELGYESYQDSDYNKALEYYNKALDIQKQILGEKDPDTVASYISIGRIYYVLGSYNKALEYYNKALDIRKQISGERHPNTAIIYNNIGGVYYVLGDYNKALECYKKSLDIQKQVLGEKHVDTATSYKIIGAIYDDLSDYNKALEYYSKALDIRKQILGDKHPDTEIIYNNIGGIYSDLGDYNKALEYLNKSLDIQKEILGDKHPDTATSYNNIGVIYSKIGDYNKALEYLNQALDIRKQILGEKHPDTATSYMSIGGIYHSLGDYNKALEYLNKSLDIQKQILGDKHPNIAASYNNIGEVYSKLGDYNKALEYLNKSLYIQKQILGDKHPNIATSYNNIGGAYSELGDYNKALEYYNKALDIQKQILGDKHPNIAASYNNIGEVYSKLGDYNKALECYNKALDIQKQVLGEQNPDTAISYNNIGLMYIRLKDFNKAYKYIKKAYEIYNFNKDKSFQILSSSQKKDFLDKNKNYIQNLLLSGYMISPSQDEKKEIYEYFVNDKDDIFNSENILVTIASKDKSMKEKVDKLNTLKRNLGKLQANIPDEGDLKTYNEKIKLLENDIENKEIELSKLAPSFKEYHELKNITLKDLQAYLKDNELFIDFGYQGGKYYAFSMDKNGVVEFNALDSNASKSLDEDIKTFRKDIDFIQDNINSAKLADFDKLNKSSKKTLAKINSTLNSLLKDRVKNYSSLIVSSDGALRLLPFEALYDGDKYLLEKYDIRYTPSAKEYIRTHRYNTNKAKQKATLFSDPNYEVISGKNISLAATTPNTTKELETRSNSNLSGFLRLRGFKVEQNALQDRIKNISLYDREKANEENLFKLTSPEILHIITHGYFISDENIQNPMLKSGIALSGANLGLREKSDIGLVNALKLSGLELNGTNLIVLSACETGKVDINDTSSIASLPKTFIQAGARNVLMSLWKVEDKHTVRLMDELYSGKNYNQTLKEAKLSMIKENLHPFFWAAFILSGE